MRWSSTWSFFLPNDISKLSVHRSVRWSVSPSICDVEKCENAHLWCCFNHCSCMRVSMGWGWVWMGVACPCPPVCNDIATPPHLLSSLTFVLKKGSIFLPFWPRVGKEWKDLQSSFFAVSMRFYREKWGAKRRKMASPLRRHLYAFPLWLCQPRPRFPRVVFGVTVEFCSPFKV